MSEEINLSTMVSNLEDDRAYYIKRCQSLEGSLKKRKQQIKNLQLELSMEKFKNHILSKIIETHTTLKLNDIFQDSTDGIHIYNYETGNIPVHVHDYLADSTQVSYNISSSKKKPTTGKNFRSVNQVAIIDEKPQEQEEKLKQVEEKLEEIVQQNKFDAPVKETTSLIDNIFTDISTNRIVRKYLISLKDTRNKLLGRYNISDYIKLVQSHIKRLENIFSGKKSHDQKKNIEYISMSLSPLEQRLVFFGEYYNSYLEADDIQRFKTALEVHMEHPRRYIPFLFSELCNSMHNYSVAISSISEILSRVLVNPLETFNNIVYLPLEKSTRDDPYSFYSLESIDTKGQRNWKLQCRLDDFSKSLSGDLKTFCVDLFRKIYFDIFHDNLYRENYTEKFPITTQDCAQLLENIILLSKQKSFCNTLRELILEKCTIKPSKLDKFNFTGDDKLIKRTFAQENDDPEELISTVKRLFDNISKDQIDKVLSG
jgi:hypothetical protein